MCVDSFAHNIVFVGGSAGPGAPLPINTGDDDEEDDEEEEDI
jgi:hypothetical protein